MTATSRTADWGDLPPPYRILPYAIPFLVPGFRKHASPQDRVLAPEACDCEAWFDSFVERVAASIGREFLPVCRMSDGEFLFLFGRQAPSLRLSPGLRVVQRVRRMFGGIRHIGRGFQPTTAPGVSSGDFTREEWLEYRPLLGRAYLDVLDKGVLGIHLSYGERPFQEHYFPAVSRWLGDAGRRLTLENYVPFYCVYAMLRGPQMRQLAAGRRVLVVHSAIGEKRTAISHALREVGFKTVQWLPISPSRSFADTLNLATIAEPPDLCLIGAGIGKARILAQLAPLNVPCIDAGYAFEAWADPDRQWDRPYMTPDTEFDVDRIRFAPTTRPPGP